jgi:hypothetical protein
MNEDIHGWDKLAGGSGEQVWEDKWSGIRLIIDDIGVAGWVIELFEPELTALVYVAQLGEMFPDKSDAIEFAMQWMKDRPDGIHDVEDVIT